MKKARLWLIVLAIGAFTFSSCDMDSSNELGPKFSKEMKDNASLRTSGGSGGSGGSGSDDPPIDPPSDPDGG